MKYIDIIFQHHYYFVIACGLIYIALYYWYLPQKKIKNHKLLSKKAILTLRIDDFEFDGYYKNLIYKQFLHNKKVAMFQILEEIAIDTHVWRKFKYNNEFAEYIITQIKRSLDIELQMNRDFLMREYGAMAAGQIDNILTSKGYYIARSKIMSEFYKLIEVVSKNESIKGRTKKMIAIFDLIDTMIIQNFYIFKTSLEEINGTIEHVCSIWEETIYNNTIQKIKAQQ